VLTEAQKENPDLVPVDIDREETWGMPYWWRQRLHDRQREAGIRFDLRASRW
jgi:hypothetical protein